MFDEMFAELAEPSQHLMRPYWCGVWVRLSLGAVADVAPSLAVTLFSLALRHGESVAAGTLAAAVDGLLGVGDGAKPPREVFEAAHQAGAATGKDWVRRLEYVIDALTVTHMLRLRAAMCKPHHAVYAEVGRMIGD